MQVPLSFAYFRLARRIRQRELASSAGKEKKETSDGLEDDEDDDIVPKAPETGPDAPQFGTRKVYSNYTDHNSLAGVDEYQSIALSMFLEACRSASETGFKDPAYEFVTGHSLYTKIRPILRPK